MTASMLRSLAAVSTTRLVLLAMLIVIAVALACIAAGPMLVALLDRVTTTTEAAPSTLTWYMLDDGDDRGFTVGGRRWALSPSWRIIEQPARHVTLETPQGRIVLGTITRCWCSDPERHSYEFAPEAGDIVSFTHTRSRVPWPRPFVINWLGGPRPTWGRWVYHRLVWRKPSGEELNVQWRDEQRFRAGMGWSDQYLPAPPTTLLRHRS